MARETRGTVRQVSGSSLKRAREVSNESAETVDDGADGAAVAVAVRATDAPFDLEVQLPSEVVIKVPARPSMLVGELDEAAVLDRLIKEPNDDAELARLRARIIMRMMTGSLRWTYDFTRAVLEEYEWFLKYKISLYDFNDERYRPSGIIDQMWHQHVLMTKDYHEYCKLVVRKAFPRESRQETYIHHTTDPIDNRDSQFKDMRSQRASEPFSVLQRKIWFDDVALEARSHTIESAHTGSLMSLLQKITLESPKDMTLEIDGKELDVNVVVGSLPPGKRLVLKLRPICLTVVSADRSITICFKVNKYCSFERLLDGLGGRLALQSSALQLERLGKKFNRHDTIAFSGVRDGDELDLRMEQKGC